MANGLIMIDAETNKVKSRKGLFVSPVVNMLLAQKCQFLHLSQRGSPVRLLEVSATKRDVKNWHFFVVSASELGSFRFMRQCSKCQQWKSPSQFGKGSCKDGLSGWCKSCNGQYHKEKRQAIEYTDHDRTRWRLKKREQRQDPGFIQTEREASQDKEYKQRQRELRRNRRRDDPAYRAKEKNREYQRRALTKEGFTPQEWLDLCNRYGNICLCCREAKPLTVDHIKALSKGGSNTIDNLQPLCLSCNSRKKAMEIDYRW